MGKRSDSRALSTQTFNPPHPSLPCPPLRLFPRLDVVAAAYTCAKQLEIAVLIAAALFQRHNVVAFMIHPNRTTAGTGELVTLHDAASCIHP